MCILECCHISHSTFFSSLPHFFTGDSAMVLSCPCIFSCRTSGCLTRPHSTLTVSCTFLSSRVRMLLLPPASTVFCLWGVYPWWCRSLLTIHHSLLKLSHPEQPWGSPLRQSDRSLRRRDWWAHIWSFQLSFQTVVVEMVRGEALCRSTILFFPWYSLEERTCFQYHSLISLS